MQHGFVTLNNHHHNSRDLATRRKKVGLFMQVFNTCQIKYQVYRKAAVVVYLVLYYEMTMKTHRFCKSCCNMLSQIRGSIIMAGHNLTAVQRAPLCTSFSSSSLSENGIFLYILITLAYTHMSRKSCTQQYYSWKVISESVYIYTYTHDNRGELKKCLCY